MTTLAEHAASGGRFWKEDVMTLVCDLGEFALIERLRHQLPESARASMQVPAGIGDDAAIWRPTPHHDIVITTDALVESVHFRLDWTDWQSLGHKALAVNLSDIAAMGAIPRVATIALGLTGGEQVSDVEALYQGVGAIAAAFNVVIAGGDIVRSPAGVVLSVTVIGEVAASSAIRRSGALPGDLLVVSGTLGASAAGMRLLETGHVDATATAGLLVAAHLRPTPRVALGRLLVDMGASAAMDLSDGLIGDLPKLLDTSGVAATIDVGRIPILPAVVANFPGDWLNLALTGGEDYELLFSISPARFEDLVERASGIGATLTTIGLVNEYNDSVERLRLLRNGQPYAHQVGAFDHFG